MFAVIKTGGKQYRVKPGDLLVVEKLDGDPGSEIRFDQILMTGEGDSVTVGAPTVANAAVSAVLIETRKGEKIKVFKKIRRQGYRRTGGHRQIESVLRVTGVSVGDQSDKWDGQIDLTPRSELRLRARGLASRTNDSGRFVSPTSGAEADLVVAQDATGPVIHASVVEHSDTVTGDTPAPKRAAKKTAEAEGAAPAKKAAAKKTAAKKTASEEGALVEPPTSEVAEDQPQTVKAKTAKTGAQAGSETAPKKTPAKKTAAKKTTSPDGDA
jgi:large subunit ribosomal protein L21